MQAPPGKPIGSYFVSTQAGYGDPHLTTQEKAFFLKRKKTNTHYQARDISKETTMANLFLRITTGSVPNLQDPVVGDFSDARMASFIAIVGEE